MRFIALFLAAFLTAADLLAQAAPASSAEKVEPAPADSSSPPEDVWSGTLPVSLDRIRKELEKPSLFPVQPLFPVEGTNGQPTFKVEVQERNRLQELLSTLDFSGGPTPAGGIYQGEMQRVMFPSASNPLRQPFSAFNQTELLTVLLQTLAGTYLVEKAADAVSNRNREAAEAAARAELRRTVLQYCATQPNKGAGIAICDSPPPE